MTKQTELFGVWVVPTHKGLTCELQCVHQSNHYLKAENVAAAVRRLPTVHHVEIRVKE